MPPAATGRRALGLLAASATLVPLRLPSPAIAQETGRAGTGLWFDPTQLPSFTGTVERYLPNPRGDVDGLLFREGPQVVFPPDVAEAVRAAAPPGRPIVVWGIRARTAPVITMLAFGPSGEAPPTLVERVYWRLGGRVARERAERLQVSGTVRLPYYAPQGETAGAILEDGTVISLPQGVGPLEAVRDLLRPGARIAAEGPGVQGEHGRALAAERIGPGADALAPVPAPPSRPAR